MRVLMNANEQISATMMENHFQASSITAAVTATPKEMMLEILKACKMDLVTYYAEHIDNKELIDMFNDMKAVNPNIRCVIFIKKENLDQVGEELENCVDECFAIPLDSNDLMIRLRRMMRSAAQQAEPAAPAVSAKPEASLPSDKGIQTERDIYSKPVNTDFSYIPVSGHPINEVQTAVLSPTEPPQNAGGFKIDPKIAQNDDWSIAQEPGTKENTGKKSKSAAGKIFGIISKAIFFLLIVLIAILAAFLVQGKISGGTPTVAGYQLYGVLSGSMNGKEKTSFDTGSLVLVKYIPVEKIKAGDIITFRGIGADSPMTTHRVVKVNRDTKERGELTFTTKGDANEVADPNPVLASRVVGVVRAHIPYAGYLTGFAETKTGLVMLVFIPGAVVIIYELINIFKTLKNEKKKSKVK